MRVCDYCGCRREGPTGELAREHVRLLELSEIIENAIDADEDVSATFADFVDLLQRHATKEEIGLFEQARASTPLGDRIDALCDEHETLNGWLAHGATGPRVNDALLLLATHIDDEEYDLFPHVFHALDPEQWDEIELAHRAVDVIWNGADEPSGQPGSSTLEGS